MPKKKIIKEEEKIQDIKTKQVQNKPKAIKWNELDKYIGQPVWDSREKKWRILDGYKRNGYTFSITFSDIADLVSFNDRSLYLEEVKI